MLAVGACQSRQDSPQTATATQAPLSTPTGTPLEATATELPSPEPTTKPSCTEQSGNLIESAYAAVALPGEVPLLVYLPPCYSDAGPGYPVVYLLHGLPYDERHWLDLGSVDWVEPRMAAGEMPPMIVVMPYQPEPLFTSTDGGPGSYEQEFLEGVVPFVEGHYRVDSERQGLAGISRGGIWALEIAFHEPGSIAALAALSPALAVNSPRPAYDPFELASSAASLPSHILLLAGDRDWAATGTERLSQLLGGRAIQHKFTLVPGDHSDPTWSGALGEVFRFFSEALSQP